MYNLPPVYHNLFKVYILLGAICITAWTTHAQDALFSQFSNLRLYHNPAYTGSFNARVVEGGYRDQWPGIDKAYVSYMVSYDQPVKWAGGGMGVLASRDNSGSGIMTETNLMALYAYHARLNKDWQVSLALGAGMGQRAFHAAGLVFPDAGNGQSMEQVVNRSVIYPNFSSGVLFRYKSVLEWGGAVHHLSRPESSSSSIEQRLDRRFSLHTGMFIPVYRGKFGRDKFLIHPLIVFQNQGAFSRFTWGTNFIFDAFEAGAHLRQYSLLGFESLILTIGFYLGNIKFAYSFDAKMPDRQIFLTNSGAHEVTFRWQFEYNERKRRTNAINCPYD